MTIEILKFKLNDIEGGNSTIGIATALINNCMVVKGIKLMQGKNGPFVSMPCYKTSKDGKDQWIDIAYLKTKDAQEMLLAEVKKAYVKEVQLEEQSIFPLNVFVTPIYGREDSLRAIGTIEVDGLIVKGIKIRESPKGGLFVSMPQYVGSDGQWHDQIYPNNAQMRKQIAEAFMEEYKKKIQELGKSNGQIQGSQQPKKGKGR